MADIIKAYQQSMGATRFIGKKYGDADRVEGNFGAKWGEWFANGWFGILEKQLGEQQADFCEDADSYIGFMRGGCDTPFEYWIGMFLPTGTAVPDGFDCIDFPAAELGVCWIYGRESEVYMREDECIRRLQADGFEPDTTSCFERYNCPRFTTPDEKGNIILDICFFLSGILK